MKRIYDEDSYLNENEYFSKRKDRRKPKGKRSVKELKENDSRDTFSDPDLQLLYERGLITDLLGQLKSGKEATVYLASTPEGLAAAKVYSDMAVRSFKDDAVYRQGRFIGDVRIEKAIKQRSRTGLNAQQALWIFHEYSELWTLYKEGVPVPKPLVGPGIDDIFSAGRVVLMEFIGNEDEAAPRLSDIRLNEEQAQSAWKQSLAILESFLKLGKVHGDYSAYNLLWWQDKVIAIDFPQVVNIKENPNAAQLLKQDVQSLCKSFKRHGVREDPDKLFYQLKRNVDFS